VKTPFIRPMTQPHDVLDIAVEHGGRVSDDALLHLIEHVGQSGLHLQSLLDLIGTHEGVFAVFKKARALA
jgi:hypothetical protein